MSDWAHPEIEFCRPDLRIGCGIDHMTRLWTDWLASSHGFAIVPERFQETGEGEVLVLGTFVGRPVWRERAAVRRVVSLFRLSGDKVIRLSIFIDR